MPHKNAPYAVASLAIGIFSLVMSSFPFAGIVAGVIAIIFSRKAVAAVRHYPAVYKGGMATAGLICGIIAMFMNFFMTSIFLWAEAEERSHSEKTKKNP